MERTLACSASKDDRGVQSSRSATRRWEPMLRTCKSRWELKSFTTSSGVAPLQWCRSFPRRSESSNSRPYFSCNISCKTQATASTECNTKALRGLCLCLCCSSLTASLIPPKAEAKSMASRPVPLRRCPQLRQKSMPINRCPHLAHREGFAAPPNASSSDSLDDPAAGPGRSPRRETSSRLFRGRNAGEPAGSRSLCELRE
mmetsp:Transcript_31437/g.64773  ORF Transcript_31437/g.64773 Transcript_31437/m.64773 type:complete len:201 (+) Transcript_31437:448-1050(+)